MIFGVYEPMGSLGFAETAWDSYITSLTTLKNNGCYYCGFLNLPIKPHESNSVDLGLVIARLHEVIGTGVKVTVRPNPAVLEQIVLISDVGNKIYTSDYIFRRSSQDILRRVSLRDLYSYVGHEVHDFANQPVMEEAIYGVENATAYYGHRGLWNKFGKSRSSADNQIIHVAVNSAGSTDASASEDSGGPGCSSNYVEKFLVSLTIENSLRKIGHYNVLPTTPVERLVAVALTCANHCQLKSPFETFMFRTVDSQGKTLDSTDNVWAALKELKDVFQE